MRLSIKRTKSVKEDVVSIEEQTEDEKRLTCS
jgi:hypothetical protein